MTKAEVIAELDNNIRIFERRKEAVKRTDSLWLIYFEIENAYRHALILASNIEDGG